LSAAVPLNLLRVRNFTADKPSGVPLVVMARACGDYAESEGDSRIGVVLIQPVGWAEASRNGWSLFAGFTGSCD
jgi:hypothetical protein